ncbi:sensor histidine kinase [Paraburkholderia sp. RL17-347-BIC-D]|uniref:sensor histidine kinase n=1 Tax=Paraburkholderia sp. RL17-347-BIC-D TaxID=3031632 RepID=UPI0038B856FA
MSIVMPAIIVLETAIILWLSILFTRRWRMALASRSLKPPNLADYVERAMTREAAMRPQVFTMSAGAGPRDVVSRAGSSAERRVEQHQVAEEAISPEAGQRARAERPITDRDHAAASARSVRRQSHESGGRSAGLNDSHVVVLEKGSGEAYFREALALLPISILMLDERGRMLMVNRQAARLFGYECDELIGKPVELLVPALHLDRQVVPRADVFASSVVHGRSPLYELPGRRNNGTEFQVEIGLNPFHFDDDSVTLACIIDTAERYELERNRRDLAHLTRVSIVGQLTASLAHELNQPLTAILSNVQAAQRFLTADPIDLDEVREILNDIVQADYRASEVIRRIRAVVKKGDLEVVSLDLAGIIRDVVLLVRGDAIVRGTRVALDIEDDLPSVRGDKVQLQQVMLNLLLNAFDAMSGVPSVDRVVSVTLMRESTNTVCIAIRDRGHGLTADKLDKIFKPFFTSKPQGLGLGLSISRTIIDMHHGRLWAENNIDRGATFFVTLPVGDATEQDESR